MSVNQKNGLFFCVVTGGGGHRRLPRARALAALLCKLPGRSTRSAAAGNEFDGPEGACCSMIGPLGCVIMHWQSLLIFL